MTIYVFIVLLHVIGTVLGAGGATVAEVQINKALKDKQVTPDERALMHGNYFLIRVGMAFLALSVIGMIWYYINDNNIERLLGDKVLFKGFLFGLIIANAIAMTRRWIPLWLGASVSFTSWWGAAVLGVAGRLPYSFLIYFIVFVAAVLVVAGISHLIRKRMIGG